MAADPLGRRMHDDRGAEVERPAQDRRGRVVHDQRHAELASDPRHLGDREDVQLRVRQGLRVPAARLRVGRAAEVLRIRGIHEAALDAHLAHGVREQVPRAAIEVGGGDEVVARLAEVLDREERGRLAGAERERSDPALELRDALLEHRVGRVHYPGVDVAQFLEREQVRGMVRRIELEARGLVDRDRDGVGRRVGAIARVQHDGLGVAAPGCHLALLPAIGWRPSRPATRRCHPAGGARARPANGAMHGPERRGADGRGPGR